MRLFIAVPLSNEAAEFISRSLKETRQKIIKTDARFSPEEHWHFTLVFLGNQPKEKLEAIKDALQNIGEKITSPEIRFDAVQYGPPVRLARMVWVTTTRETSEELDAIKRLIEEELEQAGVRWQKENRPFHGHLTVARFKPEPVKFLPHIETKLEYSYAATSINLIQSTLKRTGAEYETLLAVSLQPVS